MKSLFRLCICASSFASISVFFYSTVTAQAVTQSPQIEWGRYFDDNQPGFDWSREDLGDRIYYYEGNVYIVGRSKSDTNAFVNCSGAASSGDGDAFVASYNPFCNTYNWIRYWGGPTSQDYAYCAAFDKVGDTSWIYIAGEVNELNAKSELPTATVCVTSGTSTVFQKKPSDKKDAFIAKYNLTSGKLIRWTYIGGKGMDQILSLDVDTITHNVYFAGYTDSTIITDFSPYTFTPYKSTFTGMGKGFFGAMDSCLNTLKYFSYYGGNGNDRMHDLEILYANNTRYLVMSGTTQSCSGIVPDGGNYFDNTYGGGTKDQKNPDAFLIIWDVNHLSSMPDWCSYVGGADIDRGRGVDINSNNDIYLVAQTLSDPDTGAAATFVPTADAYMQAKETRYDCFLAKFHVNSFAAPMSVHMDLLTYFGGGKDDYVKSVRAFHTNGSSDGRDSVVIAGLTYSNDMPSSDTTSYFLSKTINGNGKEKKRDAFLAVLTKDPSNPTQKQKLSSFAYLGGERDETDIKQDSTLVQKSYNPGLALGPNGCVFIIYSTLGTKTKTNGNIPVEYSAFHEDPDTNGKPRPDAYFAEVYPFTQHFFEPLCGHQNQLKETGILQNGIVSFYPVPFSDVTTLRIESATAKSAQIRIYDSYGKLIVDKRVAIDGAFTENNFDLSAYANGVYLTRIMMDNAEYESKIIKE